MKTSEGVSTTKTGKKFKNYGGKLPKQYNNGDKSLKDRADTKLRKF